MNQGRVQEISEQSKREKWPFPKTFEALKDAGVASYRFDLLTCDTVFKGNDGTSLPEPLTGRGRADIAPALDAAAVVAAIKRHMLERTPFLDFCSEVALAGVQYWEVDMNARTCTYFGMDGGKHVEHVPSIAA